MSLKTQIQSKNRLVRGKSVGSLTPSLWLDCLKSLLDDPEYETRYDEIWDFRENTQIHCTFEECEKFLGAEATLRPDSTERRVAIVVGDDATYGIARMFQELADSRGHGGIQVFRNLDIAEDWIDCSQIGFPAC
jgi:hypothetical protein